MTETQKKLAAVLGTLFMLCACCGGFGFYGWSLLQQVMVTDPEQVREIGKQIADYERPEGYQEFMAFDAANARIIAMADGDVTSERLIFLIQVPDIEGVSEAEMEAQLRTYLNRFGGQPVSFAFDRTEKRTINDKEVDVTYNTGKNRSGDIFQQMLVFVENDRGKALIIAQGREADWDQATLDHFLNSIH